MKILNIVSSNIVQDPRILKTNGNYKNITNTHLMLGMNNKTFTKERLEKLDFNINYLAKEMKIDQSLANY